MRQLLGRGQRHELAAIFKPAGLNDAVKQTGLESRDDALQARRVQQAIEQATPVSRLAPCELVTGPVRAVGRRCVRWQGALTAVSTMNGF